MIYKRERQFGRRPLQPEEAQKILQAIPQDSLNGMQHFALLLTALATRSRLLNVLNLRMRHIETLPSEVQQLAAGYFEALRAQGNDQPNDFMFPNLTWLILKHSLAITPRTFVLILKDLAERAGVDPDAIGQSTWRATAVVIHWGPGGFPAFAQRLTTRVLD